MFFSLISSFGTLVIEPETKKLAEEFIKSNPKLCGIVGLGLLFGSAVYFTNKSAIEEKLWLNITVSLRITKKNLMAEAILLECKNESKSNHMAIHSEFGNKFVLPNGTYSINNFFVRIEDEYIIVYSYTHTFEELEKYCKKLVQKWMAPSVVTRYAILTDNNWKFFTRQPRTSIPLEATRNISFVFNSIDNFKKQKEFNHPNRYGILIHGKPGKYKSATVEYAAARYGMGVYMIYLTDESLTSSKLVSTTQTIPPNSIICFDEIDKFFLSKNTKLGIGDILTAIDGPGRLAESTLVFMTANDLSVFPEEFFTRLVRPGRIDLVTEYT